MSTSPCEHTPATPQDLTLTSLLQLMSGAFTDSVVAHVLSHRSHLPEDVQDRLAAVINREVSVQGFPNFPERALPGMLKPAVISGLRESDSLAGAVLSAWVESHPFLRDAVTEHLCNRGIDAEQLDFTGHQLRDYWSSHEWMSERDSILESHDDLDRDDVALMLCCVTGRMPSDTVEPPVGKDSNMGQNILDQTISYLEELAVDSPEWEAVPGFLASVEALSEANAAARKVLASREALEDAVSEFLGRHSRQLAYIELDVSGWTVPVDFDPSFASEALDLIRQLDELIATFESIDTQGPTFAETVRLLKEQEEVMPRIRTVKSDLDVILAPANGPDRPPDRPSSDERNPDEVPGEPDLGREDHSTTVPPETPEMSTDATLSALSLSDRILDFEPGILEYPVVLDNSTDFVALTPAANHPGATIEVSAESQDGDDARRLESHGGVCAVEKIPVGRTRIQVNVTAEDGGTARTYNLAVTREPSSDSTLSTLVSSVEQIEFSPDLSEYAAEIPDSVDELSLAFETTHEAATVELTLEGPDGVADGAIELGDGRCDISDIPEGRSFVSLVVTAEDTVTTRKYRVSLARQESRRADHVELMWSLVARDDLAGAYWISKTLAGQVQVPPSLPLLLKAVQGARWLSPDSKDFVEDLFMTVSETSTPFDDDAQAMLGLAAALQPSIIAPETNLLAWLATPDCLPSLEGIVSPVRNFANWGYALRPEHIRGDEGQRRLDELIAEASSRASGWLEDADRRHHNLVRATNVLRQLCSDGGVLNELLGPAAGDRRGEVERVKSDTEVLRQESSRSEVIAEADGVMLGSNPRSPIAGAARAWLHRAIGEACDLAARWCVLVERDYENREQAESRWLFDQVSELRSQVESVSPTVLGDLSETAAGSSRADLTASARCLARSMLQMLGYLGIDEGPDPGPPVPSHVRDLETVVRNAVQGAAGIAHDGQLEVGLSRRLLWVPQVDLADDGRPRDSGAPVNLDTPDVARFSDDIPIDAAVRARIESGDFRFIDLLRTVLAADPSDDTNIPYATDLAAARETLLEHLSSTRDDVNQAANDGVIEYEGSTWNDFTNALNDMDVGKVLNFQEAHDTLEAIQTSVGEERTRRRGELIDDWEELTADPVGDSDPEMAFIADLTRTFALASRDEPLDIRVMEDCVSRMRNYRSGDRIDLELASADASRETLEEFLGFCNGMGDRQPHFGQGGGLREQVHRPR